MGSRGGQKKQPAAKQELKSPLVPEPFHSPFRGLAATFQPKPAHPKTDPKRTGAATNPPRGGLATSGPRAGVASTSSRTGVGSTPGDTRVAAAPRTNVRATEPELSDADALAASLDGVAPLTKLNSRVRIRRKADFSSIENARREDIAALDRAEGFDVTFDNRYVRARAAGVSRETLSRLENGEFPICAHLDLHGMPLDDARKAVDEFLSLQQKRGHRCVLIITGKGKNSIGGRAVLREQVPEWLARGPSSRRVLAFASARPCDGGLGALVVLMRASSSSKNRIDVEHGGVGRV